MPSAATERVTPAVVAIAGLLLTKEEEDLLRHYRPYGVMLFGRNIDNPTQVRQLTAAISKATGRHKQHIWIDQEGGKVQRCAPPHWAQYPEARYFGERYQRDPEAAIKECETNAYAIALQLLEIGINVNCAPVLDVPADNAHPVIGSRAFSSEAEVVAALGQAAISGTLRGGVTPIMKHLPGHGRARHDSHLSLPRIAASRTEIAARDYLPFVACARLCPLAMVGHMAFDCIDAGVPASCSRLVINQVVRGQIGFGGMIVSDAIEMEALSGTLAARTRAVLAAGCDLALCGSGDVSQTECVLGAARVFLEQTQR